MHASAFALHGVAGAACAVAGRASNAVVPSAADPAATPNIFRSFPMIQTSHLSTIVDSCSVLRVRDTTAESDETTTR
jgi:hypothetical protein